jgi:pilus assembly protein Flp/PilA
LSQVIFWKPSLPALTLRAMLARLRQLLTDKSGATSIEYGIIASGVALAVIAGLNGIGTRLNTKLTAISTQLH